MLTIVYAGTDDLGLADGSTILFVDKTNTNCSDGNTRATALNPDSPWCSVGKSLDTALGNDTIYIVGNTTYFGYADLQDRYLNGYLRIWGYPNYRPNVTMGEEAVWNGTAIWGNVSIAGRNVWRTNFSISSGNRGFVSLPNGTTLLTSNTITDVNGSYGGVGMCVFNPSGEFATCQFNDTSFDPNGQLIRMRGSQAETIKIDDVDAPIWISNLHIPNSDIGISLLNVTNVLIENCSFDTNRYDIAIDTKTGVTGTNYTIRNNEHNFNWNNIWTWGDFYTSGITSAQPAHILIDGQSSAVNNVFINHNDFTGSFDGIRQKITYTSSQDHEYAFNNFSNIHDDAFELGETTNQNTTVKNNYLYDVFVCFSTAPAHSNLSMSFIYNNLCYANKSVFYQRPSTYWPGKAVKNYNESGRYASVNWSWSNNLLYGGGSAAQSTAWETRTPYVGQVNFNNVTNNILYTYDAFVMKGSGNNTNTLFDFNNYYREQPGDLGEYWGDESDGTNRADLADAKAAAGWPAAWDVNSLNIQPDYNTTVGWGGKAGLLWNSTMIDAGVSHSWRITDFFGNPIYGTPDIGAVEYQPTYNVSALSFMVGTMTRVYADGLSRNINASTGSSAELFISNFTAYSGTTARPLMMDVLVYSDSITLFNFTANVSTAKSLIYTFQGLNASTIYNVSVNGVLLGNVTTDASGDVSYSYSAAAGVRNFVLVPTQNGTEAAPVISALLNTSLSSTSERITFTTDVATNGTVMISNGTVSAISTQATFTTGHTFDMVGLVANMTYYWNVTACTVGGTCANSINYSFTTPEAVEPAVHIASQESIILTSVQSGNAIFYFTIIVALAFVLVGIIAFFTNINNMQQLNVQGGIMELSMVVVLVVVVLIGMIWIGSMIAAIG